MKFMLMSACEDSYDQLMRNYPQLKNYKIEKSELRDSETNELLFEPMEIEISSIEELVKLSKELDQRLIVDGNGEIITIYDFFIE